MANRSYRKSSQASGAKIFALVFLVSMLLLVIAGATFVGVKSEGFKNFDFFTGTSTGASTGTNGSDNTSEDTTAFALLLNGEAFSSVNILEAEEIRIDVKNGGNFTVKVAPIEDADFDFFLDGTLHKFATADGDYNRAFDVQVNVEDGYFVLHSGAKNIETILRAAYEDHEISDIDCNYSGALLEVIVTSDRGEKLTFTIAGIVGDVLTIEFNVDEVIF